jgi:hypothetical protein
MEITMVWRIQNLTQALFQATAWIAVARIRFAVVQNETNRILTGAYGTKEVDAYWAGLTK